MKGLLISKILLSWQRVKPQYSFFGDFEAIRAFLGGLTWSKTLENLHKHWNPRQLGRRWGWDPGVAQRLYGAPWNTSENLMCSSHILARINIKLGTHIDLIEPNNFCTACHGLRPTGSQLFYCFPPDSFFFFTDYPGIFGGLNMVKNSWKCAHTLEPVAVRTPLRLGPGRGTEALRRPLENHQKTWCVAHTYLHVFIWNSVHI